MLVIQMCSKTTRGAPTGRHTERNMDIAVVRQRQTSVIQTVQETAEVPQSRQFDRVVDVAVGTQRQTTDDPMLRCSDEHKVPFREMTEGRSDHDSGDDEQSEESSDAEVINGDADDTKETVANDTQMRYSPSFFPENTHVCVETDVNRPKEKGQPVMEGTQLRLSQLAATQATRQVSEPELKRAVSHAFETSCTVVPDSAGSNPGGRESCRSGVHE